MGVQQNDRSNEDETCLLLAASNGHLETGKWLIENGCSTDERDQYGFSCLLLASMEGHLEIVKWLIENGCSINDKNIDDDSCLLLAVCNGLPFRNSEMVTRKWMFNKPKGQK